MSGNALITYNEMKDIATAAAKSGLFGMKTPEQALALMAISQAEGMPPALAIRDFHIIQGRPALKADAMLARFQGAGGSVEWKEYTDHRVAAVFSHKQGGSVEIDWTMERAKQAGLGGKDNWKNYPRQMLRARVISEGIRTVFPGCVAGFYSPEEVQDFTPDKPAPQRDVTPSKPLEPEIVMTAAELVALIEEQPTEDDIKRICSEHKSDYELLDDSDKRAVVAARKAKIALIREAA